MKICVYTCITGGYDILKEIEYKNMEIDYLCFTNNQILKSETWKIIYVDEELDDLLLQRKIKINCCRYLSNYDASLYIDGKVMMRKDVLPFIRENLKDDIDLVGYKHPERDCIYDEIYFCVLFRKERLSTGISIYEMYERDGFPHHYGLSDSAILLRRHNDRVARLMDQWFNMVTTYSRRDQLSFFYCLWKSSVTHVFLDDNIYNNEFFIIDYWHHPQPVQMEKICLADFNPEGRYDPTLLIESIYTSGLTETVLTIIVPIDCDCFRIRVDELGNWLLSCSTDDDLHIELINGIPLVDQFLFMDNFDIKISGNMNKGRIIEIKLKIKELNRYELVKCLIQCNSQRIHLAENINEYEKLKEELEAIRFSRSYKFSQALASLTHKFHNNVLY